MADLDHSLWKIKSFDRWEQKRLELRGSHLCAACRELSIERLGSSFTFFPKVGQFHTDDTDYPASARLSIPDSNEPPQPRCSFCEYYYIPKAAFVAKLDKAETKSQLSYGPRWSLVYHPEWHGLRSMDDRHDFDIWTDEGDPAVEFGIRASRPITSTGSKSSTEWIKQKVAECTSGHERCNQVHAIAKSTSPKLNIEAPDGRVLPTRLVDLGAHLSPDAILVDTASLARPIYAALSYCWGTGVDTSYQTTSQNLTQYQQRVPYASLPLTIRQAFDFVRRLGVRYLWVDSLCIVQKSTSDWATESGKMHGTYGNAHITLAVDPGKTVEAGMFNKAGGRMALKTAQVVSKLSDGRTSSLYFRNIPSTDGRQELDSTSFGRPLSDSSLAARAWAFQERRLSPRIVHFNERQLIWECRELIISEDNTWYSPIPRVARDDTLAPCILFEPLRNLSILPDFWYGQVDGVLEQFSACELTVLDDKLPALSGMAAKIATATSSPYLAGLWLDHGLQRGLAWRRRTDLGSGLTHRPDRGPSFSWVAWDGLTRWEVSNAPPAFTIDDYSITLKENNPFGRVGPCSLTLTGSVIHGSVRISTDPKDHGTVGSRRMYIEDRDVGTVLMDLVRSPAVDQVAYIQLFEMLPKALALEKTSEGRYKRLGLATLNADALHLFEESSSETVTLV